MYSQIPFSRILINVCTCLEFPVFMESFLIAPNTNDLHLIYFHNYKIKYAKKWAKGLGGVGGGGQFYALC